VLEIQKKEVTENFFHTGLLSQKKKKRFKEALEPKVFMALGARGKEGSGDLINFVPV